MRQWWYVGSKGVQPSLTGCGTERKSQVLGRDRVTILFFLNYSLPGWCWDWPSFVSFLGLLPAAALVPPPPNSLHFISAPEPALSSSQTVGLGTPAGWRSAPLPREGGSEAQLRGRESNRGRCDELCRCSSVCVGSEGHMETPGS